MTLSRTLSRWTLGSAVLAATMVSCAATTVVTRWQDPATPRLAFTNIIALVISSDLSLRRVGEDELCRQVTRVPCSPAYAILPDAALPNADTVKFIVEKAGFDGALVFRVANAREKVTYVPPTYGPTFWGYYRFAGPGYSPGYVQTDQVVRVETSIYSVRDDKLVWVGTTDTMNPNSVSALVKDVAKAVRKELERTGAIPAPQ
jgi:hypothetical protein